jgi:hypothetical protein
MGLSVGMGGHVFHGGYGLASHTYGHALDFTIEATAVLADGSVIKASTTGNSTLFWALQLLLWNSDRDEVSNNYCTARELPLILRLFMECDPSTSWISGSSKLRKLYYAAAGDEYTCGHRYTQRLSHLVSGRGVSWLGGRFQAVAEPLLAKLGRTYLRLDRFPSLCE